MDVLSIKTVEEVNENREKVIQKIQESRGEGWWDTSDRFQFVNRNVVSTIQRDALFEIVAALNSNDDDIGIGIGGCGILNTIYSLNVQGDSDILADGRWLPFLDNSISYIINSHTLEHIPNTFNVLTEWIRVLKPNGFIAITMPDKNLFLHDNANPKHKWYDLAPAEMTADELKQILDKLENVEILIFNTNQNNFDINVLLRKKVPNG